MQKRATKTFSRGWRISVALARALFIEPDILLLDEPTIGCLLFSSLKYLYILNKIVIFSLSGRIILTFMLSYGILLCEMAKDIVVSHVTGIIHLHEQKLTTYTGYYDTFKRTREEQLKNQQKAFEANECARAHMQSFIDKFRYNAKCASLV